jgi:DNA-binding FadR family transcriptional regulator
MEEHEIALGHLRHVVTAAGLSPSGRLKPERELATELGISRRAVRRALDVLETEGVLSRRQGHGTFVNGVASDPFQRLASFNNPLDLIEVRLTLEPTLARLAAVRASQDDVDALISLAEETHRARGPGEYEKADAAFHLRVALAARNRVFQTLFEAVMTVVQSATWRKGLETGHCVNNQAVYAECHRGVAEAIAARDGTAAETLMRDHLGRVQQQLLAMLYPTMAQPA